MITLVIIFFPEPIHSDKSNLTAANFGLRGPLWTVLVWHTDTWIYIKDFYMYGLFKKCNHYRCSLHRCVISLGYTFVSMSHLTPNSRRKTN